MNKTTWSIDQAHSEIGFKVKHMMVSNVYGRFLWFEGDANIDEDNFENSTFTFSADIASVDSGNPDRDVHIQSPDFFDSVHYPKMTFKSTSIGRVDDENFTVTGDLTIKDITKPVTLSVEYSGLSMVDPWGDTKRGLSANGKINREDWGLTWNSALEAGGVLVGKEVTLSLDVQFVKQN